MNEQLALRLVESLVDDGHMARPWMRQIGIVKTLPVVLLAKWIGLIAIIEIEVDLLPFGGLHNHGVSPRARAWPRT